MKILFLSNMLPYPLEEGGNSRTLPVLKALCQRHEVSLLSFIESEEEKRFLPELRKMCASIETIPKIIRMGRIPLLRPLTALASLCSRDAYFMYKFRSLAMRKKVREILARQQFDMIHIDHLVMCQFVENETAIPRVLQEHNAEYLSVLRFSESASSLPQKLFAYIDQRKLKKYEAKMCVQMDGIIAVSGEVRDEIALITAGRANVEVVPSGVDTSYWQPAETPNDSDTISFLGHMGYPPNTKGVMWFAQKVLPLIRKQMPGAKFQIIGSNPPREIKDLTKQKNVFVTGYVPDVRPFLASSTVCVFPIFFGGGVKIKVLIAMAMGLPAVSTRMGCEGIAVEDERSVLFAEDHEAFAHRVVSLMKNEKQRSTLAREGLRLIEQVYTESKMQQKVLDVIEGFKRGPTHGDT